MKLVMYSGGAPRENRQLDRELLRLLGQKDDPRITFIPAESEGAREEYTELKASYRRFGVENFEYFLLDGRYTKKDLQRVLSSDAIYLGGGNTYHFLKLLRESGLLPKLRKFARSGGVLLGLSAGAILFTPTIDTAAVPSLDCDENDVGLRDFKAMKLVPFEFSPHYESKRKSDKELCMHSAGLKYPIYACPDGSGIVVEGEKITFLGPLAVFFKGEKYSLQ